MEPEERKRKVDWLLRYQDCLRTEARLQARRQEAQTAATATTQQMTGMPGSGQPGRKVETGALLLAECSAELEKQQAETLRVRQEIETAINGLENGLQREVLHWRYLTRRKNCFRPLDWYYVAQRLFISVPHAKRMHRKALEALKEDTP